MAWLTALSKQEALQQLSAGLTDPSADLPCFGLISVCMAGIPPIRIPPFTGSILRDRPPARSRACPWRRGHAATALGPRPRQRHRHDPAAGPEPRLQPRLRDDHRPDPAGHHRHPARQRRRAGPAADQRDTPPAQGHGARLHAPALPRAHRSRDPGDPLLATRLCASSPTRPCPARRPAGGSSPGTHSPRATTTPATPR